MAALRAGDARVAEAAFGQATEEADTSPVRSLAVVFLASQGEVCLLEGRLRDADALNRQALEHGLADGREMPVNGFGYLGLAKVLYERNDLAQARERAETGLSLLGQGGITEAFGNGHAALALIRQGLGDTAGASRDADLAVQLARASGLSRTIAEAGAYGTRLWLAQGRAAQAAGWIDELAQVETGETLREFEELTVARIRIVRGDAGAALTMLRRLRSAADAAGRLGRVHEIEALRVLALDATGERPAALALLRTTLQATEPEGYTRLYLDEGPAMAVLLRWLALRDDNPIARRLLAQWRTLETGAQPAQGAAPGQTLLDVPSERELEVLRMLPGDLSIPEIAAQLGIAPSTVRTHVKRLYDILHAHSRFEAVQRAREAGFL